ncbi:MAG TPA: ABC transporter ATP-binding protein [Blastocatellia bacterium]|nr:ABC transporter ATP-binding protein [Blastocatellia bacterium]
MSDIVVRVEGISKQYRIGARQIGYKTLRDSLTEALRSPFRAIGSAFSGGNNRPRADAEDHIWALKDISFEVKRGEVVGIIGHNGAGKSTLLKILTCITEPTEGYADIEGRVGSLLEVGTGFHPELTGRENIFLNGAILGMKKSEIESRFDDIVAFAEVEKFIDTPVKHYSSGMYLRLAFSVAAHLEPEVLLVDEVLAVGDIKFQKRCMGKMQDVAAHGRTVLFVSHNLAAIKQLCHSCVVLRNGHVDFRGPVVEGLVHYSRDTASRPASNIGARGTIWKRLSVNGQDNGMPEPIISDQPFFVEAALELSEDLDRALLYCIVDDSNGNGIIHHRMDSDSLQSGRLKRGEYRVRAEFPPLWLMPDAYSLYFKMIGRTSAGREKRFLSDRVILDITDMSGQSAGNIRATLIPPIKWTLSPN